MKKQLQPLCLFLLSALSAGAVFADASEYDPNLSHKNDYEYDEIKDSYDWYPLSYFIDNGLYEGLVFSDKTDRLPSSVEGLDHRSPYAGVKLKFNAQSKSGKAIFMWQPKTPADYQLPCMSPTPCSGLDFYMVRDLKDIETGDKTFTAWAYMTTARPNFNNKVTILGFDMSSSVQPQLINLPLYNGLESLSIGLAKGSGDPVKVSANKSGITKPVVFYGGSAVQGIGAARPGMAYVNIVGREIDVPTAGIGLKDGGHMESDMASALAGVDASCYVLDCLAEMTESEVSANYENFINTLHAAHSSTPIVIVEAYDPFAATNRTAKEETVYQLYKKYKDSYKNLVYVPKSRLSNGDGEGMTSGYLNPLGHRAMADALCDVLQETLQIENRRSHKRAAFKDLTEGVEPDWTRDNGTQTMPAFNWATAQANSTVKDSIRWIDGKDMPTEGLGFSDSEVMQHYDRLPTSVVTNTAQVKGARVLQRDTSGEMFRFTTDSKHLKVRWTPGDNEMYLFQMSAIGNSGVDVYRFDSSANRWVFKASGGTSVQEETTISMDWTPGEACIVNLPLYNGLSKIEIGIDEDATISAIGHNNGVYKPVVVYGTSITQGNSASRPGLAFVNRIGRDLDVPVIDLGFSGSGVAEMPLSDACAAIDASCYVIDCLWNLRSVSHVEDDIEPFVRNLRDKKPNVPIVFAGFPYYASIYIGENDHYERAYSNLYAKLVSEGWKGVYYLPKTYMYPPHYRDATVDGTHPTDEGMESMAQAYGAAICKALNISPAQNPLVIGEDDPGEDEPGEPQLDPSTRRASGGDRVYSINRNNVNYWVHEFTSTDAAKEFKNISGEDLSVEYLVVGGGGAGGDGFDVYGGGGGGAGGGVLGRKTVIANGATWFVSVGAGGSAEGVLRRDPRTAAEASAISNGTSEVALALGGGAGACVSGTSATSGAAGGGGSGRDDGGQAKGKDGLFASSADGSGYPKNRGGHGYSYLAVQAAVGGAGGGGGAAASGGDGSDTQSGNGGAGITSSITGKSVVYGGGGGGAGCKTIQAGGTGYNGAGRGATADDSAQDGATGTGCGGGGGYSSTGGSGDPSAAGAGGSGVVIIRYAVSGADPGEEDPPSGESWTTFENRKYNLKKDTGTVLDAEANWSAGSASDYAIFRVYDSKKGDTPKDLTLSADWTVPEFDFGYSSGFSYTGALALGDRTLTCTKEFNVMTGNVARLTSGTIALTDTATAHVGWNAGSMALGGNAALILDGPDAAFVSTSTNQLQIGSYPGPNSRVEVLNGARFESPLELGHAREKGGTWGNVFLASGAETVVNVSSNSTYVGGFGWDDGVRTWANSLILTDGAKMIAKTIYIGGGDARESSNNVFEVSNGATLEMTGDNRVVYISRNGCEGNMMKIENTTLNAEKGHGNFEIYLEPNHNGTLYLAGTNTSVLLGRTQSFPSTTKLVIDVSGPQVGDKAMMTAVNYEFDSASTLYITSSADLAGVGPFEVKVLADYGDAMNAIPDGVIKIDPAFEGRFVIDTTTDPKSLIVRYTGAGPTPQGEGWEAAQKAGDTATAADVWGAAVPADLAGVNAKRLAAWATAKGVDFADAATIKTEAFLLNCANTDAAIEKAKEEFKFKAIKPGEVPEIDGDFNGTVVIKGSTDLETWNEKASASDSFYKAVLEFGK